MADMAELKNVVRLGTVMSVDKGRMTARVKWGDKGGITSAPLHILRHAHGEGTEPWIPSVGTLALCVMTPDGGGDGFIVGEV